MSAYQQHVPYNRLFHSNVCVRLNHGVYTRPSALIPKSRVLDLTDISNTSEIYQLNASNPISSTPQIGYRPKKSNTMILTRPNSKKRLPAQQRVFPANTLHLLTPKVSKISMNNTIRTRTEPTDRTDERFPATPQPLRTSRVSESIEQELRQQNSHLRAENDLLKDELEFLRDKFRKMLGGKYRPNCKEKLF